MATKVKAPTEMGLRKITKPVISTDVMGNRNVEVRAVGAWVQPASSLPSEGVVCFKNIFNLSEIHRNFHVYACTFCLQTEITLVDALLIIHKCIFFLAMVMNAF